MAKNSTFPIFPVDFEPFSNQSLQIFPRKPTGLSVQPLLNECQHSDSKTIQKVHKLYKNEDVEVFRLLWSHSEVILKQNAATVSSKTVIHSSFFRFFVVELIVLELRSKSLGKSTEIVSKTTKTSNFSIVQDQFEAFFFHKLNLSRDESSPKQQFAPPLGVLTF